MMNKDNITHKGIIAPINKEKDKEYGLNAHSAINIYGCYLHNGQYKYNLTSNRVIPGAPNTIAGKGDDLC